VTPAELNTLIGSIGVSYIAILGGFKWILTHIDNKQKLLSEEAAKERAQFALKEAEARADLSRRLHDEIRVLRDDINVMHAGAKLMTRRIYDLEKTIHNTPDLDLPVTFGWPPV
jgi:hypothetical protein